MHVVKEKKIGEGGFGSVYICRDRASNKKYALKEIEMKQGECLKCLIEIHIMVKAKHQTINRSIGVSFESNNLIILQNMATSDLKKWREDNVPNENTIRKIMHQITSGLDYLHYYLGIIHGDIKPGNILCFPNNFFKLTDFSVSVDKSWCNKDKSLCTTTHRAPEVWLKQEIDEKVDIWSLGCTLHELIFNFKLFPCQSSGMTKEERIRKKKEIFYNSMNVIYDWANISEQLDDLKYKKVKTKYLPLEKCDGYNNNDMNNLMFQMLRIDPKKRPSTKEIFEHAFLKGKNKNPNKDCVHEIADYTRYDDFLTGKKRPSNSLYPHIQFLILKKEIIKYWLDIARHSCIIYDKYVTQKNNKSTDLIHVACFCISHNLVFRCNMSTEFTRKYLKYKIKDIIVAQKQICVALDFNFY